MSPFILITKPSQGGTFALEELLRRWAVVEVEMLAELYAAEEKPLPLPKLIHYLKGSDLKLREKVKVGAFDIISIDGKPCQLLHEQQRNWTEKQRLSKHYMESKTRKL